MPDQRRVPSTDGITGKGAPALRDALHTLISEAIAHELALFHWNDQWYITDIRTGGDGTGWQPLGTGELGEHRASEWINQLAVEITEEAQGFESHSIGESHMPRVKRLIRNKLTRYKCYQPQVLPDEEHSKSFNILTGKVINGVVFGDEVLELKRYSSFEGKMERRPQERDDFFQSPLPYKLPDRVDDTPIFDEFLQRCFVDDEGNRDTESEKLIRQWIGANLLNQYSEQRMLFVRGEGGTSKGTLLRLINLLLGGNAAHVTNMADLSGQFALQPLVGKLGLIVGDMTKRPIRFVDAYDTGVQIVKSIIGGDPQSVDRKFMSRMPQVRLTTMVTAAGNSLPHFVRDDSESEAWGRRMLIVKMDNKLRPTERMQDYENRVAKLDGVGNIAFKCIVEYAGAIGENGITNWAFPKESETQLRNFMATDNSVTDFIDQCIWFGDKETCYMPQSDLALAMIGHPNWWNDWRDRGLASIRKTQDYKDALQSIVMHDGVEITRKQRYTDRSGKQTQTPFLRGAGLTHYGNERVDAGVYASTRRQDRNDNQ